MKSLHLALLFAFCLGVRARRRTGAVWERECNANAPDYPDAFRELDRAHNILPDCVLKIVESPGSPNEKPDLHKFCTADGLRTSRQCFENYSQKLSRCLTDNEKFVEDMIMTTYTNIMVDMCSGDSLEKLEAFINKLQSDHTKERAFIGILEDCGIQTEFYKMIESDDDIVFSQTEFCSDLNSMKQCTLTEFTKGVLSDLSGTLEKISSPIVRWCKQHA